MTEAKQPVIRIESDPWPMPWHLQRFNTLRWDSNMPMWFRQLCQRWYIKLYRHKGLTFDESLSVLGAVFLHCLGKQGLNPNGEVDLPNVPLSVMLSICNASRELSIVHSDGSSTHRYSVADRGIAACYALKNFWNDPEDLLNAVGYSLSDSDED